MKNNAALAYAFLLIIGDFLALLAAFSLAYILRVKFDHRSLVHQIPAQTYFFAMAAVLPLWVAVHGLIGLYNQDVYERRFAELGHLIVGSFLGMLVVVGYEFVAQKGLFPARLVAVYGLALGFGFLVLFRSVAQLARRALYGIGFGISNVLVIGDTKATDEIVEAIRDTRHTGQRVIGIVGGSVEKFKSYGSFAEALGAIAHPIHSIIQTELYRDQEKNNVILRYAQENHVAYRFVPGNTDLFVGNLTVELFGGLPMIAVHQTALTGWGRIAKRLFDMLVSFVLLVVLSPVFLLIILLQYLTGGKPFFKQIRLTRFNNQFYCYKFRTLKRKYNGLLPEEGFELMGKPELAKKYRENGDFLARDPRLTKLGLVLRKTSLDELPQLLNVLKGDLSLVGPRALVPRELDSYAKKHAILSVKSGMTGLAQISGRKAIDFDERRRLDVYYVQNWSFGGDIVILLKTIKAVLSGIGAK